MGDGSWGESDPVKPDLERLQHDARADRREPVVAAVILDTAGKAFVPRRSSSAELLPGIWDLVGGHVEAGEPLLDALAREINEETGWRLRGDPWLLYVADWETHDGTANYRRHREFDFLVEIDGDFDAPRLAAGEHVDYRWVGVEDLDLLDNNAGADDGLVRHIVEAALRCADRGQIAFPHVTLFVGPPANIAVEELRRAWDPAMAAQIAAHVTVAYPHEIPDLDHVRQRLKSAAAKIRPFRLRMGSIDHDGNPANGVFANVDDMDGGWHRLRQLIVDEESGSGHPPHVTVVHPRTSGLGTTAWRHVAGHRLEETFTVAAVSLTAFEARRWLTVSEHTLAS